MIPWALGSSSLSPNDNMPEQSIVPSNTLMKEACAGHLRAPMWHMIPAIRDDLRFMAQELGGMAPKQSH